PILPLADLAREGRARELVRAARAREAIGLVSFAARQLARVLLPARAGERLRRLVRDPKLPWIRASYRARIDLDARLARAARAMEPRLAPGASLTTRAIVRQGTHPWLAHAFELEERAAARLGLEERHPFHDRRVVEVCAALPESQRRRGAETKVALR